MKNIFKALCLSFGIVFIWWFSLTLAQVISSRNSENNKVPDYYYANYKFADDWDAILDWFTKAKAKYSVGQDVSTSEFVALSKHFNKTFPHLTKDYSMVYEKCTLLADSLAREYSYKDMESLMWNSCYKSLIQAIKDINKSYTVKPTVSANPVRGMAPLTVTFDARSSSDPSYETIPVDNFYWYYRDENWVDTPMWEGQVINYKFEEAGKFIVHLVIRSSNVDEWILDWEKNITINVTPKAADIVVYANTRKMTKDSLLKMWTTEWEKWVVFDGSLTVPRWWRTILSHRWTITNQTIWFKYDSKLQSGSPSYINVPLKWNWEFKVTLTTNDNESNVVSQTYSLYMSDPVTIIKQTPKRWSTSTTFNFDGSASYSITNRLNTYYWEIFDANWWEEHGDPIKWGNDKKISMNFWNYRKRPWNYLIRLTVTDIAWNQNVETKELYVDSTPPDPQFIAVPTKIWTYPSEFTLDASSTVDIDVENKVDSLSYSWIFSTDDVDILSTENNNEKIVVRFNSVGKHKITLTATDEYWKSTKISKKIDVKSILRPQIEAIPWAITWWKNIQFKSTINEIPNPISEYSWSFWDGRTNASEHLEKTDHVYSQKWIYNVILRVTDSQWKWNDVKERVFIWEIDTPIAARRVKDSNWYYIQASEKCKIESAAWFEEVDAYPVDRYSKFTIDPWISVNTKWNSNGLQYVFSKQAILWTDKSKKTDKLTESFSELGCHYVDLQVSDTNIWKEDAVRIRFKVQNAQPKLDNITLSFPQYADNTEVAWFEDSVNSNRMSFDCEWTSNLTIKVTAVSPRDPDWVISRLRFYYYNVDDPDRKLEYKDTRMTAPYVYFVLPRIWWEYKFWAYLYDNDGGMIDSDEYLASNPSVYFPASCSDSDLPSVTLRVDSNNIQVWDEVKYTIVSHLSTNNDDFATDRTFYYDFTWDGMWDLVTKKDTATYQFLEDYEDWVVPRAAVEYRRKLWVAEWETIYVKNGIKPIFLYNSIWNTVIFRDLSVWVFQQRDICFEKSECEAWNKRYQRTHVINDVESLAAWIPTDITQNDSYIQKYKEYWDHNVSLYLKSKYWMEAETDFVVKTSDNSGNGRIAPWINMITIPETTFQKIEDPETWKVKDNRAEVFLAKNMNNTLLMYINNENEWTCYVDTDIATDSSWDGQTDNDVDLPCNKIAKIKYEPDYENAIWRIYFTIKDDAWVETLTFKNFYVWFEWYVLELDEENLEIYNDITILIDGIDDSLSENAELKNYLNRLRRNLNNTSETSALVVDINDQIENNWISLDSNQKERLDSILSRLANPDTVVAVSVWMDDYEKNKLEILALLPTSKWTTIKEKVSWLFKDFEENGSLYSPDERADALDWIWETITTEYKKNKREWENDFNLYFCDIFRYYDITSSTGKCWASAEIKDIQKHYKETREDTQSSKEESWWFPTRLKIMLIFLVWWVLTMIWIIVFFSIKARLNSSSENEDEEW